MNPQQFRLRNQIDPALAAGLLAAAAHPKALQQAINAGERAQAQQTMLALLQANVLHRTKSIISPPIEVPEEDVAFVETPGISEEKLLVSLPEPLAAITDDLPLQAPENMASQPIDLYNIPATIGGTTDIISYNEESVLVSTAPEVQPATSWRLLWLLLLVISITVGVVIWGGWLAALIWVGLVGIGMGLTLAIRPKHRQPLL
jgi:hypothetical protein